MEQKIQPKDADTITDSFFFDLSCGNIFTPTSPSSTQKDYVPLSTTDPDNLSLSSPSQIMISKDVHDDTLGGVEQAILFEKDREREQETYNPLSITSSDQFVPTTIATQNVDGTSQDVTSFETDDGLTISVKV